MSATTNLGKVSVTPKGAWAITNTYEILDIVTSGGSSYLAKQDVPTGVQLSNTSYWIMIAEKGDGGEVTSASASISGGYGTPGVTVTAGGTAHERTLAFAFTNLRGEKGETGNGIDSVYKTGTSGLVDTYTILFTDGSTYEFEVNNGTASIDNTLTKSGWAADAKVVGDTKASIDGFYETMGVGVADNLTPYSEDSGATQDIPFIAQGTGCGNGESVVDTGSYLQFKKKLGNTVGVNQGIEIPPTDGSAVINGITFTDNRDGSWTVSGTATADASKSVYSSACPSGRKVIFFGCPAGGSATTYFLQDAWTGYRDEGNGYIETSATAYDLRIIVKSGTVISTPLKFTPKRSDLSLWYGSDANIPSDLLSHPENWGRYYAGSLAYNAGTLESADGTVLKSIGRNIWNEQTEKGSIDNNGQDVAYNLELRTVGYTEVIPNTQYYLFNGSNWNVAIYYYDSGKNFISTSWLTNKAPFTTPANAHFIRARFGDNYGTTYKSDITISLYYPGESGYDQYYPYSVLAEVDTGSEVLRGVEGSRDEKLPNGAVARNRAVIDLGMLNWAKGTGSNGYFYAELSGMKQQTGAAQQFSGISSKYVATLSRTNADWNSTTNEDKVIGTRHTTNYVCIVDSAFASYSGAQVATALSGVMLEYPLATPTTEQGTAFAENIPCDDFGSMYWTQTKGIPQGNEIFYPVDYKASIDTLYNRVEGDMGAIVIDSQLEVVADRIPEAPSEDGTYTLKATVSSGTKTYSWVADE